MYDSGVEGYPIIIYGIGIPRYHGIFILLPHFSFSIFAFVVLSTCPANITFVHWVQLWNQQVTLLTHFSKW